VILAMTIMAKNAADYGLDHIDMDPPMEFDTIEIQSPTHIALVADAVDRPLSELRELNPALLKSIAPAGYTLHVPKGTLPELESAFAVIPADKRDSWRIHRVQSGETMTALAKRYSAQTSLVSSANHDEMASAGEWMAIPAPYPGDRTRPTASSHKQSAKTHKTVSKVKSTAKSTAAAHKSPAPASGHRKTASAHAG